MKAVAFVLRRVAAVVPASVTISLGRAEFKYPWAARIIQRAARPLVGADGSILRGPGAGLRINAAGANPGYVIGTTEPPVQSVLLHHLHPGDVFYDIGAGIGFFTLIGAHLVGPSGQVVAFEPNPLTAAALRHNMALNSFRHVNVVQRAVGATPALAAITVAGTASRLVAEVTQEHPTATVEVVSLDALIEESGYPPPDFVKLDVEGAETAALEGMTRTLARARPQILCETHGTLEQVREWLSGRDYDVELVDEVVAGQRTWNVHLLATPQLSSSR